MFLRLFLLFVIVPAVELYLLIRVGSVIGVGPTLMFLLLTGVLGASLARREGLGVLQQLQTDLAQGRPPTGRLLEGLLVFIGGLLLLAPGILTDVMGLLMILGPTRRLIAPSVTRALTSQVQVHSFGGAPFDGFGAAPFEGPTADSHARQEPFGHDGPRRNASRPAENPFANPFDDLP